MSIARKIITLLSAGLVAVALSACAGGPNEESTGQYLDSSMITTKVKTAIATTDGLSPFDIQVETYKGTVQLSGFVDSEEQKQRAEEVAQDVDGVDNVVNNIQVKGGSESSTKRTY